MKYNYMYVICDEYCVLQYFFFQNELVKEWVMFGVLVSQIVIGLVFYGCFFKLKSVNYFFFGVFVVGLGLDGGEGIFVNKVCKVFK